MSLDYLQQEVVKGSLTGFIDFIKREEGCLAPLTTYNFSGKGARGRLKTLAETSYMIFELAIDDNHIPQVKEFYAEMHVFPLESLN